MSRKKLLCTFYCFLEIEFHTLPSKRTTHEFFKIKPKHIFSHYTISHQTYTTKITIFLQISHWTITAAALPRINHIRRHEKHIIWKTHYHTRNPYPHTTKTTGDHEGDGIIETI